MVFPACSVVCRRGVLAAYLLAVLTVSLSCVLYSAFYHGYMPAQVRVCRRA